MRVAAIVLAAGEGRRLGGPKALLPVGETTFLDRSCRLFLDAGLDAVITVLGAQADRVRHQVPLPEEVAVVVNDRWRSGMLSSIWCGLDVAELQGADAVLVHPVDHPLVAPATIHRIRDALVKGAAVAVPVFEDRRGHPGGFARRVFEELRRAPVDRGARAVLAADPARVVAVLGDAGCLAGIDTPEAYTRLLRGGAG